MDRWSSLRMGVGALVLVGAAMIVGRPHATEVAADALTTVPIQQFAYLPATLTVSPGTTVEWLEEDDIPHTVTTLPGSAAGSAEVFDSGIMYRGDTFRYTFTTAGTFDYYCTLHPAMRATVIVRALERDQ